MSRRAGQVSSRGRMPIICQLSTACSILLTALASVTFQRGRASEKDTASRRSEADHPSMLLFANGSCADADSARRSDSGIVSTSAHADKKPSCRKTPWINCDCGVSSSRFVTVECRCCFRLLQRQWTSHRGQLASVGVKWCRLAWLHGRPNGPRIEVATWTASCFSRRTAERERVQSTKSVVYSAERDWIVFGHLEVTRPAMEKR